MHKSLSALLAFAAASAVFSAHAESPTAASDAFVSSATRAEVQAELAAFRASGSNPWATSYNPLRGFTGSKTRQQVVGEFLAERDVVHQMGREDSGSHLLSQAARGTRFDPVLAQR